MKKILVVTSAILAVAISLAGCKKDPESAASVKASEVKASSLEESGATRAFEDKDDFMAVIQTLDPASLESVGNVISGVAEVISKITDPIMDPEVMSARNATVEQVSSAFDEIGDDINEFMETYNTTGSASLSINKEFGEITDLDPTGAVKVSIPTLIAKASMSTSGKSEITNKASGSIKAVTDISVDCTKIDENSVVKNVIASVGVDGSGNIKMVADETKETLSGKINATATANAGATICLPYEEGTVGGKILANASLSFKCDDINKIVNDFSEMEMDEIIEALAVFITVNVKVNVYDDSNKLVCELLSINSVEELMNFIESISGEE